DVFRDRAGRDEVDTRRGDRAQSGRVDVARSLELLALARVRVAQCDALAHRVEREVVEHDAIGVSVQRFSELRQGLDFDLERSVWRDLLGRAYRGRDAADGRDVIFLDQDRVEQTDTMILATAAAYGVL